MVLFWINEVAELLSLLIAQRASDIPMLGFEPWLCPFINNLTLSYIIYIILVFFFFFGYYNKILVAISL